MNSSGAGSIPNTEPTITVCPRCGPQSISFAGRVISELCDACRANYDTRAAEHQARMAKYRKELGICPHCGRSG